MMGIFILSCKKAEKPVIPPPCQVICTLVDEQTNLPIPNVKTILNYGHSSGIVYSNFEGKICYPGTGAIYGYVFLPENYVSKSYEWIEWNSVIKLQPKQSPAYLRIIAYEAYAPFNGNATIWFDNPYSTWSYTVNDDDTLICEASPILGILHVNDFPYNEDINYTAIPGDTVDINIVF